MWWLLSRGRVGGRGRGRGEGLGLVGGGLWALL